jgi:hypothetical protein
MKNDPEKISGRAKGGVARAESLTPLERKAIAQKGAVARWGTKPLQVTHKGNFKEDFGIDVECYVLNDEKKTAVISKRGMGTALGLGGGGTALTRFVAGKTVSNVLGAKIVEAIDNPLIIKAPTLGVDTPLVTIHAYDVSLLIDICRAVATAYQTGKLAPRWENIATQALIIVNASAKLGIQELVYKLAGYNSSKEEVIKAFKLFVQEEVRDYEREFPNQLYAHWQRLYEIQPPARGKPWEYRHLTVKHIYYPLAKSSGKILQLVKAEKAKDGDRKKKLFQFLSDIGIKALRMQIGEVLGMAKVSKTSAEYERHINEQFGDQLELNF